jgi:hypothetical protein
MQHAWEGYEIVTKYYSEYVKGRYHLEHLAVDGKTISSWIFKTKHSVRV